jgi:hypothetical protein
MRLTKEERHGLSVALNEATLLGVEIDTDRKLAAATFSVMTLPEAGLPPHDSRVQFIFSPLGRVAASLRLGRWNDSEAEVVPFQIDGLLSVVKGFGGLPIYGWEFFDVHEKDFVRWSDRLSFDYRGGTEGLEHSILLFQEGHDRHLDLCLWFDTFEIRDPEGKEISMVDFIVGGKRWWDGLYSGDERTSNSGIIPLKNI